MPMMLKGANLRMPLHVGLPGEDEHLQRFLFCGGADISQREHTGDQRRVPSQGRMSNFIVN